MQWVSLYCSIISHVCSRLYVYMPTHVRLESTRDNCEMTSGFHHEPYTIICYGCVRVESQLFHSHLERNVEGQLFHSSSCWSSESTFVPFLELVLYHEHLRYPSLAL